MTISEYTQAIRARTLPLLCLTFLLAWCNNVAAESKNLRISADIAPIHSLVSLVIGDQSTVNLIVPPDLSPHDFALKPSQLRTLNQAQLIVIVSEDFSPSLSRHLKTLSPDNLILDLSKTLAENESHDNDIHKDRTHKEDTHLHDDEHSWLNPQNAITWLDHIAQVVATIDEPNRNKYELNATAAIASLTQLYQELTEQLASVRTAPYIVHHDAYQHFAHAFGLAKPQAIALSDARAPSAAKLKQIRKAGEDSHCIFSEVQHDDAIIDTVSAGLGMKRGILDPLGSDIPIGPNLYETLMQTLANRFSECLAD